MGLGHICRNCLLYSVLILALHLVKVMDIDGGCILAMSWDSLHAYFFLSHEGCHCNYWLNDCKVKVRQLYAYVEIQLLY